RADDRPEERERRTVAQTDQEELRQLRLPRDPRAEQSADEAENHRHDAAAARAARNRAPDAARERRDQEVEQELEERHGAEDATGRPHTFDSPPPAEHGFRLPAHGWPCGTMPSQGRARWRTPNPPRRATPRKTGKSITSCVPSAVPRATSSRWRDPRSSRRPASCAATTRSASSTSARKPARKTSEERGVRQPADRAIRLDRDVGALLPAEEIRDLAKAMAMAGRGRETHGTAQHGGGPRADAGPPPPHRL